MSSQTVRAERDGAITTITFDNPPHQLLTGAMMVELERVVGDLEHDASTRAVILTGAHPERFLAHFSVRELVEGVEALALRPTPSQAGASLRVVGGLARVPGARGRLERSPVGGALELLRFHDVMLRLGRLDKVVIAALNGSAMGGGCEVALACDLRYMADGDFVIGQPEMAVGITPGGGGTQRLARMLGPAKALELILECTALSPAEALEVGIVNQVVAPESLLDEARATAQRLARRPALAVAAAKRAVYEGGSRPLRDGLHVERAAFMPTLADPEAVRLMRAYADATDRDGPPFYDPETRDAWLEGTAVDPTS
jgi:enoyl-CoA hydratase